MATIPFVSPQGVDLFLKTPKQDVHWSVIESYVPQDTPYFCGAACIETLLEANEFYHNINYPVRQEELFQGEAACVRNRDQIMGKGGHPGIAIEDLSKILALFFHQVTLLYAEDLTAADFKQTLQSSFSKRQKNIIINFYGPNLKLPLNGHYSTIGAIHFEKEMILLLDPARHKVGWYWTKIESLFSAMIRLRKYTPRCRGFVIVDELKMDKEHSQPQQ